MTPGIAVSDHADPTNASSRNTCAAVVLAAGKGTRFRSELPKVLHQIAGRSMIHWVLAALRPLAVDRIVVVVGHAADAVSAEVHAVSEQPVVTVEQTEQRGTGHAVGAAFAAGALDDVERVVVVPGDAPLLGSAPLAALAAAQPGHDAALLTTVLDDPTGYGRIMRTPTGGIERIVEERDADAQQRAVTEVGTSIYAFDVERLRTEVARLDTDNAQGEQYLTDVVEPMAAAGGVVAVRAAAAATGGVNDREQLARAAATLRQAMLETLMRDGVTVIDPATTYVGADCVVDADATLLPGTHLEGLTHVGAGATVGPDCRLVDTTVGAGASVTYTVALSADIGPDAVVGPFTYLRPDARLEQRAKAGAFVEIKQSVIGPGSKVPHLSYVGNTTVGSDSNVGAATVTVNYDGRRKHPTTIGDRVRIGADTMLIAPVKIGDDAYTGAGSVITRDVPAGALAVERSEQRIIDGYAERRRRRDER